MCSILSSDTKPMVLGFSVSQDMILRIHWTFELVKKRLQRSGRL